MRANHSILVVDDNELNRDLLRRNLEPEGYQIVLATNGVEAMELAAVERFDLVLLDLLMPEMDGFSVLQHMKSIPLLRDVPIVVVSALSEPEHIHRCVKLGAADYIVKPINAALVKARVWRHLAHSSLHHQGIDPARTRDQSQGAHILVIDDQVLNRDLLALRLTKMGYMAKTAESAAAAMGVLEHEDIDLILLDLMMPEVDGFQFLEQLRAIPRFAKMPVIILSAEDTSDAMVRGLSLGAEDYVVKPYYAPLLKTRIDACLAAARLRDAK